MTDDSDNTESTVSPAAALAKIQSLPSLEDTESEMKDAVIQLGEYVSSLVPGMQWGWYYDRSAGGCMPPYSQTDGTDVSLQNYGGSTAIPDDVWPKVLEQARQVAASFGATNVETFQDKPGSHEVRFYSHENTALQIGTMKLAAISASTGCRLPKGNAGS